MIEWVLIIFFYVGLMSDKDSMAATNVPGFASEQECNAAADKVKPLVSGTTKVFKFACVKRTVLK